MAIQIQLRRGTAAEWTSGNPTLATGEMGVETDTGKIKVGDGATAWTSLGYTVPNLDVEDLVNVSVSNLASGETLTWNGNAWVNTNLTTTITASIVDSAPETLDTLNEIAAALGDDSDFANTIANSIATKVSRVDGTVTSANTSATVVRNITLSTSEPTGGIDGDVWLKYTA